LGYLNYFDLGYYLIAANISDMAAMGCRPSGLLTVVRYSKRMADADFVEVFRGMRRAADDYQTVIIGGDTGGYVADVFSATAFAIVDRGKYLSRHGLRAGDFVCVSGPIGGGIGALTYFKELKPKGATILAEEEEILLRFWKRPRPRVDVGSLLVQTELATACMDISDGLKATIDQLTAISGGKFRLTETEIPIHSLVQKIAAQAGLDPLTFASSASVDFELFFTVDPSKWREAQAVFQNANLNIYRIGTVGSDFGNDLIRANGEIVPMPGIAWQHQLGDHVQEIVGLAGSAS
jgi:thiamine-monophosphate kinase